MRWTRIPGFKAYVLREDGSVFRVKRRVCRMIKHRLNSKGYPRVELCVNGRRTWMFVHRLIAQAWLPRVEGRDIVDHADRNPLNFSPSNLSWVTLEENNQKRYDDEKRYAEAVADLAPAHSFFPERVKDV